MGKVQGDKKLKIPATNANSVKTTIPESGRLVLGAKGLNKALSLDSELKEFLIVLLLSEMLEVVCGFDKNKPFLKVF